MIMKKIIFYLLIILMSSCHKNIQRDIVNKIEQQCKNSDTCTIKISDITDFEWDKMYIFNESSSLEDINKVLGFNYEYFVDIARRIVFIKSNIVVYHEDHFPYPEEKPDGKVFFRLESDTMKYGVFTVDKAVFKTQKKEIDESIYYELTSLR